MYTTTAAPPLAREKGAPITPMLAKGTGLYTTQRADVEGHSVETHHPAPELVGDHHLEGALGASGEAQW